VIEISFSTPVGLQKDEFDLLEVHGLGAVTDGFHHGGDAEVSDAT